MLDVTPVKLTLQYTMTVFGKTVCTAESAHCFLNSKGHILRIDKDLPEFFEKLNACR